MLEEATYAGDPATGVGQALVRGTHRRIDTDLFLGAVSTAPTVAQGHTCARPVDDGCPNQPLLRTILDLAGRGQVVRTFR